MPRTRATTTTLLATVLLATLVAALLAAPAAAHVTADPDVADAPFFKIDLRVGHGCEGSPTTALRVRVPDGVDGVAPQVVAGWDVEVDTDAAGAATEVAWVGGSLPDGHMQEFGLSGRFTDEAGDVVYFPVVQECVRGEHRWIDVPPTLEEWGDLEEPAPYVRLAFRDGGATEAADGSGQGGFAGADPLAVGGLVAGLLGLAAGGLALARTRKA